MIIIGTRGKTLNLGLAGHENCPTCETQRPFHRYLDYRYGHLDWVIRVVTEKQYYKLCEICRRGVTLDAKQTEESLGRNPIPWFDRAGLYVVGVGFAAVIGVVIVANL